MMKEESMKNTDDSLLVINGGSSSVKFALYPTDEPFDRILCGKIDQIGLHGTTLTVNDPSVGRPWSCAIDVSDHRSAITFLIHWLEGQDRFSSVRAVGHRVVHGMNHTGPELLTPELLDELRHITPYDPDHMPDEIALIEAFRQRHPTLPQVACFDTAFHSTLPRVATLLPLPRRFDAKGMRRYGFHGLSYAYLIEELFRVAGTARAQHRVILAHLGNGASVAAVRDGKSVDTSMGFTPAGGLIMGTRSGDIDPGVAWYMMQSENLTPKQFNALINHDSGLLGISETSSDMRDLLARESDDIRAAEAVALFCYQAKKWIGSFVAVLGGLDTLVFAGGIGENCPTVRSRICEGLGFLGIEIEEKKNKTNAEVISVDASRAEVRVIRTDEELMIARSVSRTLGLGTMSTRELLAM